MNAGGMQLWAGILGASGVGIGAFGAHALKATLEANGRAPTFQTGVQVRVPPSCAAGILPLLTLLSFPDPGPATQYHLLHAVALLALSGATKGDEHSAVAKCWISGTVLFSGSLYGLACTSLASAPVACYWRCPRGESRERGG